MLTKNAPAGSAPKDPNAMKERLKKKVLVIGGALALMWLIEVIDTLFGQPFNSYGVRPRTTDGLVGIFFAPFLHGDFEHLLSNTLPFAFLGFLTMLRGIRHFFIVTAIVTVVGGVLVWVVGGTNTSHIGASGVIFGYFGFIMAMGLFERSLKSIAMAVLVGLAYGGLIFGIMPSQPGVSWEGHLFGFLAGVGTAWQLSRQDRLNRAKKPA
jgi:membrane associated rhomboid family serine protease